MIFSEIGPQTLNRELNVFLESSKLSLSQVAKKLGVSKGHLSEIKNGKAQPALNTGLRILKMCGLEAEQRKAWAHFYNTSISEEYLEVHAAWQKENARKLNEKVSFLLARDLDLMNAYVDIVGEEDKGIHLVDLRYEYGRGIEGKLEKLVKQDVIAVEQTDLGKLYKTGKVDPIMTKNSSYDLVKTLVDDQQMQYQAGEHKGKFKFHINDVNPEGHQLLVELLDRTMNEASKIMADHKMARKEGGERFAFEILLGKLKTFAFITLLGLATFLGDSSSTYAQNGGLSGGSDRTTIEYMLGGHLWDRVEELPDITINWPEVYIAGTYVKVNNLCHFPSEHKIRTLKPVMTCTRFELKTLVCHASTDGQKDCYLEESEEAMSIAKSPYAGRIMERVCEEEKEMDHTLNLKKGGVFVRFNDPATGKPSNNTLVMEDNGQDDAFTFNVEIYQEHQDDLGKYKSFLTSKDFQLPICL